MDAKELESNALYSVMAMESWRQAWIILVSSKYDGLEGSWPGPAEEL